MGEVTYNPGRDITPQFVNIVARWLNASPELFAVLRYLGSGSKDYAFIRDGDQFVRLIDACPDGTEIIVFRDRQLPLRGVVTKELIAQTQKLIPDGEEYLWVSTDPESSGDIRLCGGFGDTHKDLTEELHELLGDSVAIGPCPPFFEDDNESMVSASKGGLDGPR
jgi:hypothetical protein